MCDSSIFPPRERNHACEFVLLTKLAFDEPPHRPFAPYTPKKDVGILMLNLDL